MLRQFVIDAPCLIDAPYEIYSEILGINKGLRIVSCSITSSK